MWTRSSGCALTLWRAFIEPMTLHALAYNLGNFLRTLALPGEVDRWSLTSLREKVVKIGAKVIGNGRYAIFQMARWRCRASCSAVSSTGSRGCGRQARPHADARRGQRRAAGGSRSARSAYSRCRRQAGMPSKLSPTRGAGVNTVPSLARRPTLLALELTREVSRLRNGDGSVHLGNAG